MTFSIITVCFNAENEIRETLESIRRQSFQDYELVLIDGASTDYTLTIAKQYEGLVTMKCLSEPDNGIYDAMNKGVKLATGEFLYFLNAGDRFLNEDVLLNVSRCIAEANVDIIHGSVIMVDGHGRAKVLSGKSDRVSLFGSTINHQAIFAHRNLFYKKTPFDLELKIFADYNWILENFFRPSVKVLPVETAIAVYKRGGFSDSNYENIGKKEIKIVRNRHYSKRQQLVIKIIRQRKFRWLYSFFSRSGFFRKKILRFIGDLR